MQKQKSSVSVIVPARDEAGTIQNLVDRVPVMGSATEIVFIEGFSTDNTWKEIQRVIKKNKTPQLTIRGFQQKGQKGKKSATLQGLEEARNDILMILDSDLSVAPEDLPMFYKAIESKQGKFINGSRFIYPQEEKAMRFLNTIGNRAFALIFSLLLKQRITDTLCGTKVFWRKDYQRIKTITQAFAEEDPFGDFQLFLGAALLKLRIVEIPVRYYARTYGTTKISRFTDGIKLVKVVFKFVQYYLTHTQNRRNK